MISISTLYHKPYSSEWYDFPKEGTKHRSYYIFGSPHEFHVIHEDGSISSAWSYGEKHFTYSYDELHAQQEADKQQKIINKERKELLKVFQEMSIEELREAVRKINS